MRPVRRLQRISVAAGVMAIALAGSYLAFAQGPATSAPLPTLPPLAQMEPHLYDSSGCPLGPESDAADARLVPQCGPTDPQASVPTARTRLDLRGFQGDRYAGPLNSDAAVVLADTVSTTSTGTWRAWGLARNETSRTIGIKVTAVLLDSAGGTLTTVAASSAVGAVRSGEPAPFVLTSTVPAAQVAGVRWSGAATPSGTATKRDFSIMLNWTLPYGDREPAASYYRDPAVGPPYPYVLSGEIQNVGTNAVTRPHVVVAWESDDGRVQWVDTAEAGQVPYRASESATFAPTLAAGALMPFLLTVADTSAGPTLADLTPTVWVATS
jgi:hypothetical protein